MQNHIELKHRIEELATKLIEGTSTNIEDLEFKKLYKVYENLDILGITS